MTKSIPPLQAIHAFVATVHASSFRAAAESLALSPSALSRRIATLENYLGVNLYDRTGPRPRLTEAGMIYCEAIEGSIDQIQRASTLVSQRIPGQPLRLQLSQSLAMNWLLPKSAEMQQQLSGREVDIRVGREVGPIYTGSCDMGIVSTPRNLCGLPHERLLDVESGVVAAPILIGGETPPSAPEELTAFTLLAPRDPSEIWNAWLPATTAKDVGPRLFDTVVMSYEAASAGLGLSLGIPLHIDRYLRDNRLRFCMPETRSTPYGYDLVYASEAVRRRADVKALSAYLHETVDDSLRFFKRSVNLAA